MDINQKLDEILLKNNIIQEVSYDKAIGVVHKLEEEVLTGHTIGLYGVGIEAEGLLHFISRHTENFKIDFCFDKTISNYQYKEIIPKSSVYPIESIIEMDVDYVLIGSYEYRVTFCEKLDILGYQGKVIDLYECLKDYIEDHFTDYKNLFEIKQRYLKAWGIEKLELLQKLIKKYILLKDFSNAFQYIDLYISGNHLEKRRYEILKRDLDVLFQEIKIHIRERHKRDIIINWVDALSYYDVPRFPFLKQKTEMGALFENAYTVMPWTTETTKTILSGEYPIEGKLFLREHLSKNNMKLLDILDENGYSFKYFGMPKFAKLFDNADMSCVHCFENKYSGSMQKQWDALDLLCKSEKPVCILIHTLRETHEPFICGEGDTLKWFGSAKSDWAQEDCKKQAEVAGKYIDSQLQFYEKFYGEDAIEIYMSDHGRVGNSPMDENKIHIMLSICGSNIDPVTIQSMFSLIKFPDLVKKIIFGESDWESLTGEYVIIENLDAYNELVVQNTLSGKLSREEMYQCRGIVTAKDRYFLYAYGKEYYFINNMQNKNEINSSTYKKRISDLKKICGGHFINILKYKKFMHSRKLYKGIDIDLCKFDFS